MTLNQIIIAQTTPFSPVQSDFFSDITAKKCDAFYGCIIVALDTIAEATNQDDRNAAIVTYNEALSYALRSGLPVAKIRQHCRAAHKRCLKTQLVNILKAVVDGDMDRRETLVDWYEDDRQRMIDVGYIVSGIDTAMMQFASTTANASEDAS